MVISKSTVGAPTPLQVRNILESTTFDLGTTGWDEYYGWGEINAYIAVANTPQQNVFYRVSLLVIVDPAKGEWFIALYVLKDSGGFKCLWLMKMNCWRII